MSSLEMKALPKGWEVKKFTECIQKVKKTSKIPKKSFLQEGKYPIISQEVGLINGFWDKKVDVLQVRKPIVIFGDHTKIVKYVDFDFVLGADGVKVFLPINKLDSKFFAYQIRSIKLENLGYARHYRLLKKENIVIPPLPEQQKIVTLLDEAFAQIDRAKANIEQNIVNAKELFQSKLNEIFSQRGDGWEEKMFQDVCILQRGFDLPKRLRKEGQYDLISSSGIIDSHVEYKVEGPGVVTGRSGSIGNVFFIEKDFWPLNTTLYIKDFKGNLPKYVYFFIENFDLKKYSSGAGVPTLNRNNVHKELTLSTSNIEEQSFIIRDLDNLNSTTKKLVLLYHQKLENLEELKKSLLEKAFSGALTRDSMTAS